MLIKKKKWYSFSRSYRVILPSSFNIVLLSTLVSSTQLLVSVYSTADNSLTFELFQELKLFYLTELKGYQQPVNNFTVTQTL